MNIGRYEVINELGQGGMAIVYLARDPLIKRQVAIKVLPCQFTFDPQFRARFQREVEVIATLEPWPAEYSNINFHTIYKSGTEQYGGLDWRAWTAGIEYVAGKPTLFALIHFQWEP